jgi:hypothetical protein
VTLSGAATVFAAASALLGTPVNADMGAALALCLDTELDIPARAAAFETQGWSREGEEDNPRDILAAAATLGSLDALDQPTWTTTRAWADGLSNELATKSISGEAIVLRSSDAQAAIALQRNIFGLQTCLYVGNEPGLEPLVRVLDGSILRKIGSVQRIRGDGPKSSISAHFLDEPGRAQIEPPLRFGATFTLVLDRQPGDLQ